MAQSPVQFATDCDRSVPETCFQPDGSVWVFGYGSLLWKVTFPYEEVVTGCAKGFHRRFCQGSADHRGTVDRPGRVVSVTEGEGDEVMWGKVYRIAAAQVDEVVAGLSLREQGGYTTKAVLVHDSGAAEPFHAVMYYSTPGSANHIEGEAVEATAEVIAAAVGPSGPNTEYLYNLTEALRAMGKPDPYCEQLTSLTKRIVEAKTTQ